MYTTKRPLYENGNVGQYNEKLYKVLVMLKGEKYGKILYDRFLFDSGHCTCIPSKRWAKNILYHLSYKMKITSYRDYANGLRLSNEQVMVIHRTLYTRVRNLQPE